MPRTPHRSHRSAAPRRTTLLAVTLVTALVLAACGSSKNAPDADAGEARSTTTAAAGGDPTEGVALTGATCEGGDTAGELELTDASGTVTLPGVATKVVALEWTYVEDLLAVGVQPIGVADVPGYGTWVRAEPALDAGVEDVGSRQEPSIERIRRLQPDLIITSADREGGAGIDQLTDIAPVLSFDAYPSDGTTQWEEMTTTFCTVATAVGKADEADAVLRDLDAKIAEGRTAIEDADLPTEEVVLAQGEGTPDAPMFRMFTDNAMVMQLVNGLGLENGWDGPEEEYGFNSVTLEGLVDAGDAWFLPVAPDDALAEFNEKYGDSPIWTSLGFVQEDRIRPLGNDAWFFGGPLSADYLVDKIVEALTA